MYTVMDALKVIEGKSRNFFKIKRMKKEKEFKRYEQILRIDSQIAHE